MYRVFIYFTYLHFTDPANLCEHPHGRHCASCFAMTSLTSSVLYTGGSISNGDLMWQIWTKALLAGSTDGFHTDLHVDCCMKAVPAAQVTVRENGRPLRSEPVTLQYEKVSFFCDKRSWHAWRWLSKWRLNRCHHVIHVLTCSVAFLCTYTRYQKLHSKIITYIYIRVYIYTNMYIRVYIYEYIYTSIYIYEYIYEYIYIRVYIRIYIYIYEYIYIYIYIRIYIYIYTSVYTNIYITEYIYKIYIYTSIYIYEYIYIRVYTFINNARHTNNSILGFGSLQLCHMGIASQDCQVGCKGGFSDTLYSDILYSCVSLTLIIGSGATYFGGILSHLDGERSAPLRIVGDCHQTARCHFTEAREPHSQRCCSFRSRVQLICCGNWANRLPAARSQCTQYYGSATGWKILWEKFVDRSRMRWEDIRRVSSLLLNRRERRRLAGNMRIWNWIIEEGRASCGLSHHWRKRRRRIFGFVT
jgi:hypothetical protein